MPARKEIKWVEDAKGCWLCTSHAKASGYPVKWFHGKRCCISRIIWTQCFGEIPEGMCVLHKCDNPGCIRIHHLFLGTHADNGKDRDSKGRHKFIPHTGERNGNHKLTWEQVKEIRVDARPYWKIALDHLISERTIGRIKRNENWRPTK